MEDYTPKFIKDENGKLLYVEMLLATDRCENCNKIMIEAGRELFPKYWKIDQKAQMAKLGIVFKASHDYSGKHYCHECKKSGRLTFVCSLCNQTRSTDLVQESIGDFPMSYLCTPCYETVTAKVWGDMIEELKERHKYDFE